MARPLRIQYPGAFYHVEGKGSEGRRIFLSPADYEKFKEYLFEAQQKFNAVVHSYVLMGNAYQLILETREANLSRFMHHLAGCYTTYLSNRRGLKGRLFQGRYKAILIDEKSLLLELSRYMYLNPVRARLAKRPEEYRHSSYRTYIQKESQEPVSTGLILSMVSADPGRARRKYREFVEAGTAKRLTNPLQTVYGQAIAGEPSFVKKVVTRVTSEQRPGKAASRLTTARRTSALDHILATLSSHFKVPSKTFLTRRSMYRNIAIYLAKKYTGLTNKEIGARFGNITYSAVTRVATRVAERAQKDKTLQGQLSGVEEQLTQVKP